MFLFLNEQYEVLNIEARKTMSYNYTNVTEHIIAPTVKFVPIICFTSF